MLGAGGESRKVPTLASCKDAGAQAGEPAGTLCAPNCRVLREPRPRLASKHMHMDAYISQQKRGGLSGHYTEIVCFST